MTWIGLNTAIIKAACAAVNMSYNLTVKVFDGIFGELPHALLLGAVLLIQVYSALIRNSSIYGATMPHLRVLIAIVSSAPYSIALGVTHPILYTIFTPAAR
jgi:hypothetical protein